MATKIQMLAALSYIDTQLDDLQDEFGDLPEQLKEKKDNADSMQAIVDETEGILKDIRDFVSAAKITLVELKDKEENLAKQQFLVRNNKEFDAISKEIEHLKSEHEKLSTRMRTEGLKEENIMRILDDQKKDAAKAKDEYDEKLKEYESLSLEQNDDVKHFHQLRKKLLVTILPDNLEDYERIRKFHPDAAVQVKKNSCMGCFSAVPPQKIVELRNNQEKIFTCENCGRMLVPEDLMMDDSLLDNLNL